MVYILLCLATVEACSCGPHGVANDVNMMNMDILVPHRKANAVSYDDCNNRLHFRSLDLTYMKELILFVYSWTTNILVVNVNGLQPWPSWPKRHPGYHCEAFMPHIMKMAHNFDDQSTCGANHYDDGTPVTSKHATSDISLSMYSGMLQKCKSPPNNWKIPQLFKFPNKYSGKIS